MHYVGLKISPLLRLVPFSVLLTCVVSKIACTYIVSWHLRFCDLADQISKLLKARQIYFRRNVRASLP